VDTYFLYQPTADDETVLADFRKKWGGATRRATRRRLYQLLSFNYVMIYEVIRYITSYWFITRLKFSRSNEVAISTKTYEITGQEVSSLLGDQAQDDGSRWISTAVITYSFCILDPFFIAYLRHEFYNSTLFTKQV
jgi:hypothetical protein